MQNIAEIRERLLLGGALSQEDLVTVQAHLGKGDFASRTASCEILLTYGSEPATTRAFEELLLICGDVVREMPPNAFEVLNILSALPPQILREHEVFKEVIIQAAKCSFEDVRFSALAPAASLRSAGDPVGIEILTAAISDGSEMVQWQAQLLLSKCP